MFRIGMRRLILCAGATCVLLGGLVLFSLPGLSAPQTNTPTAAELARVQARTEDLHRRAFVALEKVDADAPTGALAATGNAESAATAVVGPGSAAFDNRISVSPEEAVKRAKGLSGQVRSVSLVQRAEGRPVYVVKGDQTRIRVDATTGDVQAVPDR